MNNKTYLDINSTLAKKYYYLYTFHRSVLDNYFEKNYSKMNKITYKDILPGINKKLDYYCNSIMKNKPIYGKNRWIPGSVD